MKAHLKRLHITPFSPDLLPIILGTSLLPLAKNISYHDIQTFPESRYGYVELPTLEADKVKNKLNGAMLKGKKIKIEDAKLRKRKHEEQEPGGNVEQPTVERNTKRKKQDRKEKVLPGHELSPDRKVKRGWTEAKQSKTDKKNSKKADRQKSKYTDKDELLFRTQIPDNKTATAPGSQKKTKKNRGPEVVHEFEKTIKQPTFIKQSQRDAQGGLEYVDGRGWIDAQGEVIEPEPSNVKVRRSRKEPSEKLQVAPSLEREETSSSSQEDAAGSSSSSSSSDPSTPAAAEGLGLETPKQSKQHPLEALFKKPSKPASSQDIAKPSLELATSNFSFFDIDADKDDDDQEDPAMPGTPYSSQDIRSRGLRSAAPTPDTAHPSRFNSYGSSGMPGDEEDTGNEEEEDPTNSTPNARAASQSRGKRDPSDFEKMFWEKRGDHNRAWKARRRTVLKEKRQRENRSRRPRNW